ncbi:hypothetical protein T10_6204 [Trichinella papuae]|uniref:Uncharacterized protein n=1 Tax=Trichinella papuae TaxID=268474 RepID=A0A0V1MFT5_9BILA|nr:hypothetical protein T10_6204 [Trichinella papuae]
MTSRTCLHAASHLLVKYARFCFNIRQIVHQRLMHLGTIRRAYPHYGNLPNVTEQRVDEFGVYAWTWIVAIVRIFVKAGQNVRRICIAGYAYRADIHFNLICTNSTSPPSRRYVYIHNEILNKKKKRIHNAQCCSMEINNKNNEIVAIVMTKKHTKKMQLCLGRRYLQAIYYIHMQWRAFE